MTYTVAYTGKALKQIDSLDKAIVQRIRRFIEKLDKEQPRTLGTGLVGSDYWRYRVGDYRILVEIDDDAIVILVVAVAHRRQVYKSG